MSNSRRLYYFTEERCEDSVSNGILLNDLVGRTFDGVCFFAYWSSIEIGDGRFDFTDLISRLDICHDFGMREIIQIRDKRWDWSIDGRGQHAVPNDLVPFDEIMKFHLTGVDTRHVSHFVRVAKRWDPLVRVRFVRFVNRLAEAIGGHPALAGIEICETSLAYQHESDLKQFEYPGANKYSELVVDTFAVVRSAFSGCVVAQCLNWLPGSENAKCDVHEFVFDSVARIGGAISVTDIAPRLFPRYVDQVYSKMPRYKERIELWGRFVKTSYEEKDEHGCGVNVLDVLDYALNVLKLDRLIFRDDRFGTRPGFRETILPKLIPKASLELFHRAT